MVASVALTTIGLARIVVLASTAAIVRASLLLAVVVVTHPESGGAVGVRMAFELVARVSL